MHNNLNVSNKEEIEKRNALWLEQHQNWLNNLVTKQAISLLIKHRENIIKKMLSLSPEDADTAYRSNVYSLKTTEAMIILLTNTEQFVKQLQ